jgi:hypothetical protein
MVMLMRVRALKAMVGLEVVCWEAEVGVLRVVLVGEWMVYEWVVGYEWLWMMEKMRLLTGAGLRGGKAPRGGSCADGEGSC